MSECYLGEIRILPYSRGAPSGWQVCDGSLLSTSDYDLLFNLIGTTYGGDGQATFAVPDLRGRVPIHQGPGGRGVSPRPIGQVSGDESITLTVQQMSPHAHFMLASTDVGTSITPTNFVLAAVPASVGEQFYTPSIAGATATPFPASAVRPAGGNQPHDNTAPTLTLQYCIAFLGIYPNQP
jgi:microcystin-dependent protein